jgi:hypothetical protein
MARSGPDWGHAAPTSASYTLTDLGELAARLGSPVLYDRRGRVLWYDDFSAENMQWMGNVSGGESIVQRSTEDPRLSGDGSLYIGAGPDEDDYAEAFHYHTYPELSRTGLSLAFFHHGNTKTYWFTLDVSPGEGYYRAIFFIDMATGVISYEDEDGIEVVLGTTTQLKYDELVWGYYFHHLKIVMDPITGDYVRLQLNNQVWDMSGIGMSWHGIDSLAYIRGAVRVICGDVATTYTVIDHVAFTVEEP